MRRTYLFLITGLLIVNLLVGLAPVHAQTALTTTISQTANIRSAPDSSAQSLGVARVGTAISLDGRNDNGNWVRGITSSNIVGWVSSGTVNITTGQLNGLPIVTTDTPFTLTAPSSAPATAPQTSSVSGGKNDPNGLTVTAAANVNLRSGPHTDYRRVGGLHSGQPFTIDGRDSSALWVRGISTDGVIGWAYAEYVAITGDQVLGLPVVSVDSPFTLHAPGGTMAAVSIEEAPGTAPDVVVVPVVNTAPVSGFSYGGHVSDFSGETANWMRHAGMTWVKRQWRYSEGQDPGAVAGWIAQAHGQGFRILVSVVGHAPDLNHTGYEDQFAAFLGGIAALGADAIEVWNEPNIDREWPAGRISPAAYTTLLQKAYTAIKRANSNTLVISAAPSPTGFFGGCSGAGCDDNHFVTGMAQAGAANYMDCIGIHYNEGVLPPNAISGDPRGNSGHYTRYYQSMVDVYYNAFGGKRPLCFTELGYLTPEGYGPLSPNFAWGANTTVAQQASWLDMAVSMAARSGKVRLFIIWNVDFRNYDDDPMAGFAIIRPDGSCPACDALAR